MQDAPPSAEVATFTLFFMAFSAVVGKELLEIHDNPLLAQDRPILATYFHPTDDSDAESDFGTERSVPTTIATSTNGHYGDESFEDALEEVPVGTDTAKKSVLAENPTTTNSSRLGRNWNLPRREARQRLFMIRASRAVDSVIR